MSGFVTLREVQPEDFEIFFVHQLDDEACRMAAFPPRQRDTFMAHWAKNMAISTNKIRTILYDGQVAGNMLSYVQEGEREVGYWVGREFWGKGVATRALAAFLAELIERPLFAHVAKHNLGSQRVLEKCGFTRVGDDSWTPVEGGQLVEEWIYRLDG